MGEDQDAGFTPAKSGASIRVKVEPKFKIDLQVSYDDPHSEGTIDGPEGLTVDLMDAELFDDTVVTLTTGLDGRLVHEMTWKDLREKCGEQTPDRTPTARQGRRLPLLAAGDGADLGGCPGQST